MMKPRYSELATQLLARAGETTTDTPAVAPLAPFDRARAIGAIERALADKARRRVRNLRLLGLGAAAAVVAAVGIGHWGLRGSADARAKLEATPPASHDAAPLAIVGHAVQGNGSAHGDLGVPAKPVTVTRAGETFALGEGRPLAAGSRVVAPPGARATLAFSTGTQVAVLPDADLTIVREDAVQELRLSRGAVRAVVAKLGPAQRFLVQTPDAEVEVRGTVFRVTVVLPDPSCGNGTVTRVDVSEGVVVVRRGGAEARVAKGEAWPAGCASVAPVLDAQRVEAPELDTDVPSSRGLRTLRHSLRNQARSSASNASSLTAQNELFADAIAAKRAGNASEAIATFDQLLTSYPASPLAESASVERLRLLRRRDPARAVAAAREYLARFPDGFARAEADAILAE